MRLQSDYYDVEETIIKTLFPHAAKDKTALKSLPDIDIPHPLDELNTPFTLGELHVAIAQGKSRSAPGHDKITWQDVRNLPTHGHEALLSVVNESWETGQVHEHLKTTIIHPITKPSKDARENLKICDLFH